jgi:membrane-bound serine protease (ClpP class)
MIVLLGILIGLFVVPDAWTIPVIAGALALEAAETYVWLRISRRMGPPRVGPERLIGQTGRVVETCRPIGRVRVRGELWQARCEAGAEVDSMVRVIGRDRLILAVEPLPHDG